MQIAHGELLVAKGVILQEASTYDLRSLNRWYQSYKGAGVCHQNVRIATSRSTFESFWAHFSFSYRFHEIYGMVLWWISLVAQLHCFGTRLQQPSNLLHMTCRMADAWLVEVVSQEGRYAKQSHMAGIDVMQLSDRLKRTTFATASSAQNSAVSIPSAKSQNTVITPAESWYSARNTHHLIQLIKTTISDDDLLLNVKRFYMLDDKCWWHRTAQRLEWALIWTVTL